MGVLGDQFSHLLNHIAFESLALVDHAVQGNFRPHQQAPAIRLFIGALRVLVMHEPDRGRAHIGDDLHVIGYFLVSDGCSPAGPLGVEIVHAMEAIGLAVQQQPLVGGHVDRADAQRQFDTVADLAPRVEQGGHDRVEIGIGDAVPEVRV